VIRFADVVIGTKDIDALVGYYQQLAGMERTSEGDESFRILVDPHTKQRICIIGDPNQRPCVGLDTDDLDAALARIQSLGGKVLKKESSPSMDYAYAEDPSGNSLLVWRSK
jgi:predicted enzyme related to lactoylglutathione lyase